MLSGPGGEEGARVPWVRGNVASMKFWVSLENECSVGSDVFEGIVVFCMSRFAWDSWSR